MITAANDSEDALEGGSFCRVRMCVHCIAWKQQVGLKAVQISSALLLSSERHGRSKHSLANERTSKTHEESKRNEGEDSWKRGACVGLAAILQFTRTGVRSKRRCLRSASTPNSFWPSQGMEPNQAMALAPALRRDCTGLRLAAGTWLRKPGQGESRASPPCLEVSPFGRLGSAGTGS